MGKKYLYYFKSDSGDDMEIVSENYYENGLEFMKNEFPSEYEAWKIEGWEDDEITWCDFTRQEA